MPTRRNLFPYAAIACSLLYAALLYFQVHTTNDAYPSDLTKHMEFVERPGESAASGYSLLHALVGSVSAWFDPDGLSPTHLVGGVYVMILTAAFFVSLLWVERELAERNPTRGELWTGSVTVAVFWASMIVVPGWTQHAYVGQWTPNPWHNPTHSFSRVFSVVAFFLFLRLARTPDEPISKWCVAGFAAAIGLSVGAKPSFFFSFLPAGLLTLGFLVWRRRLDWRQGLIWSSAFLPGLVVLVATWRFVYATGDASASDGIIVAPGKAWGLYTGSIPLAVLLAAAFPLYVVVSRIRNPGFLLGFATLNWLGSFLVLFLFAEAGERFSHVNFVWTYMNGLFFFFLAAADTWFLDRMRCRPVVWWGGNALAAVHVVSGVHYFVQMLRGGSYF